MTMPTYNIEVSETLIYRGAIDAASLQEARELALDQVIDNGGDGQMVFVRVVERDAYESTFLTQAMSA